MSKLIWGKQEHRLRVNVTAAPVPALTMALSPAQLNYGIELGQDVLINVTPGGGVPSYMHGWDNYNQSPANMNAVVNVAPSDNWIRFTPLTTGTHTFDYWVSDSADPSQRVSQTITINVIPTPTVGSAPEFTWSKLPYEGQTYYHFAIDKLIGHSISGTDADGGGDVIIWVENSPLVTTDWPNDGSSLTQIPQNQCSEGGFQNFCGMFYFYRDPAHVGTYNITFKALDPQGNEGHRNMILKLEAWSETILNLNDGGSVVTLTDYNSGGYTGKDVSGDFQVNSEIRLEFELPVSSSGFDWVYTQPSSLQSNGSCSNPAGVIFEAHPSEQNKAILRYTPTVVGPLEICLSSRINVTNPATKIDHNHTHRLRFDVKTDVPALALNLNPSQTTFSATVGQMLSIDLSASGGVPGYTFGLENASSGVSFMYFSNFGQRFNFTPPANSVYTVDLYVIDSEGAKNSITITINSSNLQMAFENPVDLGNPINWSRTSGTYANNLLISGGIGSVASYTFDIGVVDALSSGNHSAGVSYDGSQWVFKFQPDESEEYAAGAAFQFQITVYDTALNSRSVDIAFNVTNELQCGANQYMAGPNLCCDLNQVAHPTDGYCVDTKDTMALVDKQDFLSETGSAGFKALCTVDSYSNLIGVDHNLGNRISFNLHPQASQVFGKVCRNLADYYKNYNVYAIGGDFIAGINVNHQEYMETILDTNITIYNPNNYASNTNSQTGTQTGGNTDPSLIDPGASPTYDADFSVEVYAGGGN